MSLSANNPYRKYAFARLLMSPYAYAALSICASAYVYGCTDLGGLPRRRVPRNVSSPVSFMGVRRSADGME